MLFCGLEFNDGYALTARELAGDARFVVAACAREDVGKHIADAHIAVRCPALRSPSVPCS